MLIVKKNLPNIGPFYNRTRNMLRRIMRLLLNAPTVKRRDELSDAPTRF